MRKRKVRGLLDPITGEAQASRAVPGPGSGSGKDDSCRAQTTTNVDCRRTTADCRGELFPMSITKAHYAAIRMTQHVEAKEC
jgi:hypothetical protein